MYTVFLVVIFVVCGGFLLWRFVIYPKTLPPARSFSPSATKRPAATVSEEMAGSRQPAAASGFQVVTHSAKQRANLRDLDGVTEAYATYLAEPGNKRKIGSLKNHDVGFTPPLTDAELHQIGTNRAEWDRLMASPD